MRIRVDRIGKQYGRLKVIGGGQDFPEPNGRVRPAWVCQCSCGNTVTVRGDDLHSGRTQSCGCYQLDRIAESLTTHGEGGKRTKTVEYYIWSGMIQRCVNEKDQFFENYGGRGIKICDRWRNSFECFLEDMGRRPSPKHSIDRIDNDGNYEPGNVRWATQTQQMRNQRKTIFITLDGEKIALQDACERFGQPVPRVKTRIFKLGWDVRKALTTKLLRKGRTFHGRTQNCQHGNPG